MRISHAFHVLAVAGSFFVAGPGHSSATSARASTAEARVQEVVLDNGLTVLLQESHTAPVVSVWVWYRAGSRHELPGRTGLTHLLEHMTFQGTEEIAAEEMAARIERQGGAYNGYTWLDQSAFFATVPRDALDGVLHLEAQRMHRARLPAETLEAQRAIVLAERARGTQSPKLVLDQAMAAAALPSHPYRWPTMGREEDLHTATREDLESLYRVAYAPSNATLVLVGDFDAADALARVRTHFEPIPGGRRLDEASLDDLPHTEAERRIGVPFASGRRHLQVSYGAPALSDPDFAAFLLAHGLIGGADGINLWTATDRASPPESRLDAALSGRRPLADESHAFFAPTRDRYLQSIRVTAREGADRDRVESAVIAAAEGLAGEVSAADLERVKKAVKARLVFEAANPTHLAHQLGLFQTLDPDRGWRGHFRLPAALDAVSLEDVKRVAGERFRPENRTVGWIGPDPRKDGTGAGEDPKAAIAPGSGPMSRYRAEPFGPPGLASATGGIAGKANGARRFGPPVKRVVLPNGLVVLAVHNPLAPEVVVRIEIAAGSGFEPPAKSGLASLTGRLIGQGSAGRSAGEFADAFRAAGATFDVRVGPERSVVEARMLAADAPTLLSALEEAVASPAASAGTFEREKAHAIARARDRSAEPASVAEWTLRASLYAESDLRGRHPEGRRATLAGLTLEDAMSFHRQSYRPDRTVVAISGDLSTAAAVKAVRDGFGAWRVGGKSGLAVGRRDPLKRSAGWIGRVFTGEDTLTEIVMGWPQDLTPGHDDWPALQVANDILAFSDRGGRLARALRVKPAIAEDVWTELRGAGAAEPFLVRARAHPDRADEAVREIQRVLARVAGEGFTEEELALARSHVLGRLALDLETNAGIAGYVAALERDRLGVDYLSTYQAKVKGLTLEELNRVASSHIASDVATVTAGPKPQ